MKSLTYVLKITAIALNTYFSAWLLLFVCSGYGGHPLSLYACLSCILICAVPPVTLITIALTFHKNLKILTSVLRIIAIILNAHLLIPLIWFHHEIYCHVHRDRMAENQKLNTPYHHFAGTK